MNTINPHNGSGDYDNEIINVRELLFKYLRRWYWFVLAIIIAVIIAFVYIKSAQTKYQVQTVILLRNDNSSSNISQMAFEGLGLGGVSKEVEDEIQVISSKKLIKQAIDSLQLQVQCFEKNGLKYIDRYNKKTLELNLSDYFLDTLSFKLDFFVKESAGKFKVEVEAANRFKSHYTLNNIQESFETPAGIFNFTATTLPEKGKKIKISIYPINSLVGSYSTRLNVSTVNKKSNAINLSLVESNIPKAEDFLNKIVYLYNLDAIIDKNIIARNTANFINERLNIITKELFDVESEVEGYKRANNLTDLSSEATLYLNTASEYEKKLTELDIQLNMVNAVESYIDKSKNDDVLIPANVITEDVSLAKSIQEYNMAVLEKMKLSQTASEKNPAFVLADQQISALKANVLASVNSVKSGIQIARADVIKRGTQFTSKIKSVPTQERQFLEIKRQQEIKQTLYLFLSQKREETALSLASTAPAARTIDKAYASLEPVAPKKKIILLVALMLGVVVPFLFIYLKELINNKVKDSKEFQRLVRAPYLGSIGTSRENERVIVREGKTTPIVEMFRLLRTNLNFILSPSKKSSVILVTSSFTGEGKSFISINLAMSLALINKKVLLVGMDIRSPMLGEYLNLPNRSEGITVYLANDSVKLEDIIFPSGFHQNFEVMPAGPVPPNPAELIMSPRLDKAIEELRTMYDYIIVDTAPIGMVSDTYLLNRIADASVFVSRQNYTPKDSITLINEIYENKRLNGLGVVLNGISSTDSGYGYGYGYGQKNIKKYKLPGLTFEDKLRNLIDKFGKK